MRCRVNAQVPLCGFSESSFSVRVIDTLGLPLQLKLMIIQLNYVISVSAINAQFTQPARHDKTVLCRVRRCELSLETVRQSLNSQPIDHSRRVAFSEEVQV